MLGHMTPEQKNLVQDSFGLVAPIAENAGTLFYQRLFELDPGLRSLFSTDLKEQSRKLMQMLTVAVRGLDNLESIAPALHALGRRHVAYGVTERHFETVANALLWTLEQGLGARFTSDVREAWVAVYTLLTAAMLAGMRAPEDALPGIPALIG